MNAGTASPMPVTWPTNTPSESEKAWAGVPGMAHEQALTVRGQAKVAINTLTTTTIANQRRSMARIILAAVARQ
jgi:hypothetical protein